MHHQFPVKGDSLWTVLRAMIVDSKRKVVIAGKRNLESGYLLDVYENDGQFVHSLGQGLLRYVIDLVLATDDRVIVLDKDCYIHMFSEHGDHLSEFKLSACFTTRSIAFHHSSEHVVVAEEEVDYVYLHIYNKDGELVRGIKTHRIRPFQLRRMIVTAEGHVALLCERELFNGSVKVFILW